MRDFALILLSWGGGFCVAWLHFVLKDKVRLDKNIERGKRLDAMQDVAIRQLREIATLRAKIERQSQPWLN